MALGSTSTTCTIVLHDDMVSKTHVLCNSALLPPGSLAYIVAPGAPRLYFTAKEAARSADAVSVHASVAKQFGFENRMRASFGIVQDVDTATAQHIELFFRDPHLSRADMWRLEAQIDGTVLYHGQRLSYLGSNVANIDSIYIGGHRVESAYVSHPHTKLIFRSGSARYILLIQISQELLEHWIDGDIMYERLVDGFLPELFGRWNALKAHHQITVVLFGRCLVRHGDALKSNSKSDIITHEDFYQVVVADISSSGGPHVLQQLKKAFNDVNFPRNVSLASQGNMTEAINIAAAEFLQDNIDPRLATTGSTIVPITAGAGLFDADHELLRRTTRLLMGNSVGVDIVSLAPKPLHPVPLFRYKQGSDIEYALPHWADISYWGPVNHSDPPKWLLPTCSDCVLDISVPRIDDSSDTPSGLLAHHDQTVFGLLSARGFPEATVGSSVLTRSQRDLVSIQTSATSQTLSNDPIKALSTTIAVVRSSSTTRPSIPKPLNSAGVGSRTGAPPHPLMQMGRKISVGPKGLALSSGVASTTISAQHVQQGKEMSLENNAATYDRPSNLAKQIRASLRRKPSQASFAQSETSDVAFPSEPIPVQSTQDSVAGFQPDPASLIEKAVMEHSGSSQVNGGDSLSATPRPDGFLSTMGVDSQQHDHDVHMSPWLTLLNPCNPRKENVRIASEYRQWQNVFPTAVSPNTFRWESMVSPAILPLLRESRISSTELDERFEKQIRRLVLSTGSVQVALRRIIALRLSSGFQVVPTRRIRDTQMPSEKIERMLLSIGDLYHELRCLSDFEIQVSEYLHVPSTLEVRHDLPYRATVQSYGHRATLTSLPLGDATENTDWSMLDDECVNPGESLGGHSKMRLVLVPVPHAHPAKGLTPAVRELSDEERRIDGIQKLTQLWQRNRHIPDERQRHHASIKVGGMSLVDRDPDPLAIEYQTRDPSAVVSAFGTTDGLTDNSPNLTLFPKSELYHSADFDMAKLVRHVQEPPPSGVEMKDRRWLTRFHLKCFRGDEMTNWLLRVFKDLGTREDAVYLGNQLMEKDIFTHVRGKHEFRDGNYFYQIKSAHRTTVYPDTAGIFAKGLRSVPSTPTTEWKYSPSVRAIQGDADSSSKSSTPTLGPSNSEGAQVLLSQKMQYNTDQGKRSSQAELLDLHYDRIHNPENCYHIQLEWSIATPKMIHEAVSRWASLVESHGLRLVQLPIREAGKVHQDHPLDQPIFVGLSQQPTSTNPETPLLHPHAASPRAADDRDGHHKAILRSLGYVLDLESAKNFPSRLDVSYSWGRPSYEFTQYIHKSGVMLAQITNDGNSDFLLLRNRLSSQWSTNLNRRAEPDSADDILRDFMRFCKDKSALQALYDEFNKPKVSPSSPYAGVSSTADADVPPMELPPYLIHRSQR